MGSRRSVANPVASGVMPMSRLQSVAVWLDERLRLTKLLESTAGHKVPAQHGSWWYVFGSGTLVCFVIQIVTGICLAFVYVPSASEAWQSLRVPQLRAAARLVSCVRCITGARTSWSR